MFQRIRYLVPILSILAVMVAGVPAQGFGPPASDVAPSLVGATSNEPVQLMDSGEPFVPTKARGPVAPAPRGPGFITTPPNFAGGNSGNPGGMAYFDLTVGGGANLIITGMDVNTLALAGAPMDISVYTYDLGAINSTPWVCPPPGLPECSPLNWTLVASGTGVSAGTGAPSAMTFAVPFNLAAGTRTGIAITLSGGVNVSAAHSYTNGNGANQSVSNAFLTLDLGTTVNFVFACPIFCPRVWNGTVYYTAIPTAPTRCCDLTGACSILDPLLCIGMGGTSTSGEDCTAPCPQPGACCDNVSGLCEANVLESNCAGRFEQVALCSQMSPLCGELPGACCLSGTSCVADTTIGCNTAGGIWYEGNCGDRPCNNFCDLPITVLDSVPMPFVSTGAVGQTPTPNFCAAGGDPDAGTGPLYYIYTATGDGDVTFDACEVDYDGVIQVYDDPITPTVAPPCAILGISANEICSDEDCDGIANGGGGTIQKFMFTGEQVLIAVGGFGGDTGTGTLRVQSILSGFGSCCPLDAGLPGATCVITDSLNCNPATSFFAAGRPCFSPLGCGPIVGCCLGPQGCEVTFEQTCSVTLGGTVVGPDCGANVGVGVFCGGNFQNNFCTIAMGLDIDCNNNVVPDTCDIAANPNLDCGDGHGGPPNGRIDRCDVRCCPGDTNTDGQLDGGDVMGFVVGILAVQPVCYTVGVCRLDTNLDNAADVGDIPSFVDRLLNATGGGPGRPDCNRPFYHLSSRGTGLLNNDLWLMDDLLNIVGRVDQAGLANSDAWGYRDGASDGAFVYFGWAGGVGRHDFGGGNGVVHFGNFSGNTTIRALAYDPSGVAGAGSFWTADFASTLVEIDAATGFPTGTSWLGAGWSLYGLSYDETDGNLWGHTTGGTIIKINTLTGAVMPGVGWVAGPWTGFAAQGGLSGYSELAGNLAAVSQGTPDELGTYDTVASQAGGVGVIIVGPVDLNAVTDPTGNLGVAVMLELPSP